SMETVKKLETGKKPHPGPGAIWEADGTQYAGTPHIGEGKAVVWDTHTNEIAGSVKSHAPGLFIRAHPKMKYVWFDSVFPPKTNEITVFQKSKPFKVVKRITEGTQTLHPEPDADGDYVFVSDWKEGVVRVYDDETLKKVKTIKDVKTPTGIFSVHRAKEHEGH
ncbi:MAG: cytochrome D1 domain-containing protein, partial [Thiohalorhabdaceae bacterium]